MNKKMKTVGLRLLLVQDRQLGDILLKTRPSHPKPSSNAWFLSSCFLCCNSLNPGKDVYMYRGDQGFCSIECRERQILIDEMNERQSLRLRLRSRLRSQRLSRKQGIFETSSISTCAY